MESYKSRILRLTNNIYNMKCGDMIAISRCKDDGNVILKCQCIDGNYDLYDVKEKITYMQEFQQTNKKPPEVQKCVECGKEFIPFRHGVLTCSHKCSKAMSSRNAREKRRLKNKVDNNKRIHESKEKTLNEILTCAMSEHITYGQYVAKYGL